MDDKYSRLRAVLSLGKEELVKQFSQEFYDYYKETLFLNSAIMRGYMERCKYFLDTVNGAGKTILDVGCGHGVQSLHFAALGAKHIFSIDINKDKIAVFKKLIRKTEINNISIKLRNAIKTGFPDNFFDAVICNEVISHVSDYRLFLTEMQRILKKGGLIFVIDGNNALNPKSVKSTADIQEKAENGPVSGTGLKKPYIEMRKEIIQKSFKNINKEKVSELSVLTKGLNKQQIKIVVKQYLKNKIITVKPNYPVVNPLTSELPEQLFNPYELAEEFRKAGFSESYARPSLPFRADRKLLRIMLKPFYPIILKHSNTFEIIAEK